MAATVTEWQQLYFEDIQAGDALPEREYGPLSVVDTVRWAGFQENWARLHYDRDYARQHSGLRTFIASGAHRQTLLIRVLTDWVGPRGTLRRLSLRHSRPTYEGDLMRFSGRASAKSERADDPWLACDLEGRNQDGAVILTGQCTVMLPSRARGAGR